MQRQLDFHSHRLRQNVGQCDHGIWAVVFFTDSMASMVLLKQQGLRDNWFRSVSFSYSLFDLLLYFYHNVYRWQHSVICCMWLYGAPIPNPLNPLMTAPWTGNRLVEMRLSLNDSQTFWIPQSSTPPGRTAQTDDDRLSTPSFRYSWNATPCTISRHRSVLHSVRPGGGGAIAMTKCSRVSLTVQCGQRKRGRITGG